MIVGAVVIALTVAVVSSVWIGSVAFGIEPQRNQPPVTIGMVAAPPPVESEQSP